MRGSKWWCRATPSGYGLLIHGRSLGYAIITLEDLERIQIDGGLDPSSTEDLQNLGVAMGLGLRAWCFIREHQLSVKPAGSGPGRPATVAVAILAMLPLAFLALWSIRRGWTSMV